MSRTLNLGVLGGTGAEGSGLALRLAAAGYQVIIGSRDATRAEAVSRELRDQLTRSGLPSAIRGADLAGTASHSDMVIVTVPYAAQRDLLLALRPLLQGKTVVDVTVPLKPPKVSEVHIPPEVSAALGAQAILGPDVKVVAAFQNVSAHELKHLDQQVDCDVLIFGDDPGARQEVAAVTEAIGLRGIHAGKLANSVAAEALTSVLIFINRHYKVPGSGIRITGIPT
jgi:8-hydroxy-5-deazaflavin:NADPH oxidoreductase